MKYSHGLNKKSTFATASRPVKAKAVTKQGKEPTHHLPTLSNLVSQRTLQKKRKKMFTQKPVNPKNILTNNQITNGEKSNSRDGQVYPASPNGNGLWNLINFCSEIILYSAYKGVNKYSVLFCSVPFLASRLTKGSGG